MAKRARSGDQWTELHCELWHLILDLFDPAEPAQVLPLLRTSKPLAWLLVPRLRDWLLNVATYYYLPAPTIKRTGTPLHETRLSLHHFVCTGPLATPLHGQQNSMARLNRIKKTWYRMVAEQQQREFDVATLQRFSECLYLLHLALLTNRLLFRHTKRCLFVANRVPLESREALAFHHFSLAHRADALAHFEHISALYQ